MSGIHTVLTQCVRVLSIERYLECFFCSTPQLYTVVNAEELQRYRWIRLILRDLSQVEVVSSCTLKALCSGLLRARCRLSPCHLGAAVGENDVTKMKNEQDSLI